MKKKAQPIKKEINVVFDTQNFSGKEGLISKDVLNLISEFSENGEFTVNWYISDIVYEEGKYIKSGISIETYTDEVTKCSAAIDQFYAYPYSCGSANLFNLISE